ncbi:uncharacterized protein LOC141549730 [Sminthopsis crassicaudata]|uniref:uncharacterized protein LOC141549730 n=1 Tax=Sminthopsis crassicaudata TaxID=9301 RepID=UPI003D681FC5
MSVKSSFISCGCLKFGKITSCVALNCRTRPLGPPTPQFPPNPPGASRGLALPPSSSLTSSDDPGHWRLRAWRGCRSRGYCWPWDAEERRETWEAAPQNVGPPSEDSVSSDRLQSVLRSVGLPASLSVVQPPAARSPTAPRGLGRRSRGREEHVRKETVKPAAAARKEEDKVLRFHAAGRTAGREPTDARLRPGRYFLPRLSPTSRREPPRSCSGTARSAPYAAPRDLGAGKSRARVKLAAASGAAAAPFAPVLPSPRPFPGLSGWLSSSAPHPLLSIWPVPEAVISNDPPRANGSLFSIGRTLGKPT